ncbi:hypothetical protein J1605_013313 [Eschrichtius robustus]|uniref:Cadherin domain-containing protein n=1 Tax=Eschrichtius robustus TaxID=9764 RepID=A0AB34GG69_ESCRO|nr:hypothetical protein J1605_013313 [Eschrichtius robustus]
MREVTDGPPVNLSRALPPCTMGVPAGNSLDSSDMSLALVLGAPSTSPLQNTCLAQDTFPTVEECVEMHQKPKEPAGVVTTGKEQLDFETGPHIFDLQICVKDDVGVTDLQVLTVQVTDVNEPPEFQGNLAKGLDLYIVEGAKPGFVYQVEAFDPEDTSQNTPLSVSLLLKPQRGFSVWSLTQEPGVSAGHSADALWSQVPVAGGLCAGRCGWGPAFAPLPYFLISPSKSFRMSANGTLFSTTEFDFEAGHSR